MLLPRWPFYLSVVLVTGVMLAAYQNFSGMDSLKSCQPLHPEISTEFQSRRLGLQSLGASPQDAFEKGAGVVNLDLDWDTLDSEKLSLGDLRARLDSKKDSPYVHLLIRPFRGKSSRIPVDLQKNGFAFDNPEVIRRYSQTVIQVLNQLNAFDSRVVGVMLAEDIGDFLGDSLPAWESFQKFAFWVRTYVRKDYPGLPVSIGTTYERWNKFESLALERKFREVQCTVDAVGLSYLPMLGSKAIRPERLRADLQGVLRDYPKHLLHIYRAGYPGSTFVGGSPTSQQEFVREMLAFWDENKSRVPYVSFIREVQDVEPDDTSHVCESPRPNLAPVSFSVGEIPVGVRTLASGSNLQLLWSKDLQFESEGLSRDLTFNPMRSDLDISDRLALLGARMDRWDLTYYLDGDSGQYIRADLVPSLKKERAEKSLRLQSLDGLASALQKRCYANGEFCGVPDQFIAK